MKVIVTQYKLTRCILHAHRVSLSEAASVQQTSIWVKLRVSMRGRDVQSVMETGVVATSKEGDQFIKEIKMSQVSSSKAIHGYSNNIQNVFRTFIYIFVLCYYVTV